MKEKKIDLNKVLDTLDGWVKVEDKIQKVVNFKTYMDGIEFIKDLAKKSEEYNHHPEINLGWCTATITFTSHDRGCITNRDITMAHETNIILKKY
tara:strand:+ start:76 stop:360 length:285 start_codon:yes stop_codon:yes gene_type:complete